MSDNGARRKVPPPPRQLVLRSDTRPDKYQAAAEQADRVVEIISSCRSGIENSISRLNTRGAAAVEQVSLVDIAPEDEDTSLTLLPTIANSSINKDTNTSNIGNIAPDWVHDEFTSLGTTPDFTNHDRSTPYPAPIYIETPFGRGANIQLLSDMIENPNLQEGATPTQIETSLMNLGDRVDQFGKHFKENVDWMGRFEAEANNIEIEVSHLKELCQARNSLGQLEQVILITERLDNYVEEMRACLIIRDEPNIQDDLEIEENNLSEHTAPNNTIASGIGSGLAEASNQPQMAGVEGRLDNPRESLRNFKARVASIERQVIENIQNPLNPNSLINRVNRLEENRATNHDVLKLVSRVNELEAFKARIEDRDMEYDIKTVQSQIVSLQTSQVATEAACRRYENLFKGVNRDFLSIKQANNRSTDNFRLLNKDMTNVKADIQRMGPTWQCPRGEDVPSGIHTRATQEEQAKSINVSGIAQLPTTTVVTLSTMQSCIPARSITTTATQGMVPNPPQISVPRINYPQVSRPDEVSWVNSSNHCLETMRTQVQPVQNLVRPRSPPNQHSTPPHNVEPRQGPQCGDVHPRQPSRDETIDISLSDSDSLTNTANLSRLGLRLKRTGRALRKMLTPPIDGALTKVMVQGIHKSLLPAVDNERKELSQLLDKYENHRIDEPNQELLNITEDIIDDARSWSLGMREKHQELDCSKKPLDKKLYDSLQRFTKDSDMNIFEFFKRFELYVEEQGSALERAALLYEQFISKEIQLELVDRRDNYQMMKIWLTRKFGDVKVITRNILSSITSENLPGAGSSIGTLTSYYRKLNSVIKRVQELEKTVDMPLIDLHNHIYSAEFMSTILMQVPEKCRFDHLDKLITAGEDPERIQGENAFLLLAKCVYRHFTMNKGNEILDASSNNGKQHRKGSPLKTKKSVNAVNVSMPEDETSGAHYQTATNNGGGVILHQTHKEFDFPCPMGGHEHEVGKCQDFFKASPGERLKGAKSKVCFSCLGPYRNCKQGCIYKRDTAKAGLHCPECKKWADKSNKTPLNILLCSDKNHPKPDDVTLGNSLKAYLTSFDPTMVKGNIKLAAHLHLAAHTNKCPDCQLNKCKCKTRTLSRPVDPNASTPIINTQTGEKIMVPEKNIIKESSNDSFYVMQLLNMEGTDVLTFFDRGANQHLIEGELAEDLDLKVVTDRPVNIGIVGGGTICTDYGTYAVTLGPTEDGYFHRITAQGIKSITSVFPQYNLEEINTEARSSKLIKASEVLPEYIGGQKVGLLIGIKNTYLDPTQEFTLPSGLSVFKSPLPDKFGSHYCYGGPHSLFTTINKEQRSFNHVNAFFMDMVTEYKNSLYPALSAVLTPGLSEGGAGFTIVTEATKEYRTMTDNGDVIYPTALDECDLHESEGTVYHNEQEACICSPISDPQPCTVRIHKAKVPVSKRKEYFDEEDQAFSEGFRCEDCAQCKKCLISDRNIMKSLQEKIEEEAIRKSLVYSEENKRFYVCLPFIKPPVEHLKKRHNGRDSNYHQALKVFQAQCKKDQVIKDAMIEVHSDLVQRGFMKKLSELSEEQQTVIASALFRHFMPWREQTKEESVSTKHRLVVDATMTGLNEILAKGSNMNAKINDILIRNRCRRHVWSSDISKMYNQLHLKDEALPYGLFLFSEDLDPNKDPDIYVMLVAWYGVTSTGGQGGNALEECVTIQAETYPAAIEPVENDRYVDDLFSGSNVREETDEQIKQTTAALLNGGFNLKYIVRSGAKPCPEASADERHLNILGYKWNTQEDILHPGFKELNFNRKKRGIKDVNPFPVATSGDVRRLLSSTFVTRRMVASKLAEIWDPVGLWEPFKVQLKLENQSLKGMDWDAPLDSALQELWKARFEQFLDVPSMTAERCIVPADAADPDKIRLVCIADAAEMAGGCAIYAGFLRKNGTYSCKLLTSRSKVMNQTVPRNELEAIKLMAETAANVKEALGNKVTETLFFTDSNIAMCWCLNLNKKLRMFTLYRVADIRRSIKRVTELDSDLDLPLFHIDGKVNVADLLTKKNSITPKDLGIESLWHNGYPWMTLPLKDMRVTRYSDLTVSQAEAEIVDIECFPEPILFSKEEKCPKGSAHGVQNMGQSTHHCNGCAHLDPTIPMQVCYGHEGGPDHCDNCECEVKFSAFSLESAKGSLHFGIIEHGWLKSLKIISILVKCASMLVHQSHTRKGVTQKPNCIICRNHTEVGKDIVELGKTYREIAKNILLKQESSRIRSILPNNKLSSFNEIDGIYYVESRLSEDNPVTTKDLGYEVFFDNTEIRSLLPVVLADSELFFCYAVHIHNNVRIHAGVEITLREISKTMMVLNNPRKILQRIRRDCPRCRIIAKKTLELRMAQHPAARTTIAPPFYHCQMDTVYGFKGQPYKNARKSFQIYALLIVCLLSGATNILALEGLETQDVVQALERHSKQHGVPAAVYVDNGTQLIALENTKFSLRDLNSHVSDSLGLKVLVSTAKSHEGRGRAEAKVKILRSMLGKLSVKSETVMTAIQWETLFSKISSQVDDVPIAKCANTNALDPGWEIITPNRLKLGRNNNRSLEGSFDLTKGSGLTTLLRKNQEIQSYWYQMFLDRIHHLIPRPEKWKNTDKINVGDICLFIYTERPGLGKDIWKIGRIKSIPRSDKVEIEFPGKAPTGIHHLPEKKVLVRSPRNISIISAVGDLNLNSRKYFESVQMESYGCP